MKICVHMRDRPRGLYVVYVVAILLFNISMYYVNSIANQRES